MVTPKLTYAELPKFQECVRRVRTAEEKSIPPAVSISMWMLQTTTGSR